MNHTTNLHLPQFEATDRILHGDFNDAFAALDAAVAAAGNCRIETGTYVGTGTSGNFDANTLSFATRPLLVAVLGNHIMLIPGTATSGTSSPVITGSNSTNSFRWTDNTLNWSNYNSADTQLNETGVTYTWIAFYAQ